MSKKCPNCGYSEVDDAKFCHICGQTLDKVSVENDSFEYDFGSRSEDKKADDFEYDFGAGTQQSAPQSDEFDFGAKEGTVQDGPFAAASYTEERPYVGTTINNFKANKNKRGVSGTSSYPAVCLSRVLRNGKHRRERILCGHSFACAFDSCVNSACRVRRKAE